MSDLIKLKRSGTVGAVPSALEYGEPAINYADGKLYYKNSSGNIVTLGSEDTFFREFFRPPAPPAPTVTAGNGEVFVSFSAPTVCAQTPITHYVVQYSTDNGTTWLTFSGGTTSSNYVNATGLTNGTAYKFRVAAVNGLGIGTYSAASASATPNPVDEYFSSVSLLLHMDGSGSTFTDSSSYARAVTANGDVTQSATQSKWGGKSAYFDGNGDYLTFGSAELSLGSGDFCVEMWIYPTATQTAFLADWRLGGGGYPAFYIQNNVLNFFDGSANVSASGTITNNAWTHVAAARSGSTLRVYADGSLVGTLTTSANMGSTGLSIARGGDNVHFTGYIDDVRITKGVARYTGSTYTVPTAAFFDH